LVIEKTEEEYFGNGSTPAPKQVNKRIFRNEVGYGDELNAPLGHDKLTMTSPFKYQNTSRVHTYQNVDPYLHRAQGYSPIQLKTLTPTKRTMAGTTTNYAYTHSPMYTGHQPQDYNELHSHFKNLDDLAKGQERDINYLLGIGPKPSTGVGLLYKERDTRSTFRPTSTFSPSKLFQHDRSPLRTQELYKETSLTPHLLTDYPELKKKEMDFQKLNSEKDINDSLLNISQNLLSETKRSLAKIRSASTIKSPEKESGKKPLAQTSVFTVVEQEKNHLKNDHQIDLDAVPVSKPSPTKANFSSGNDSQIAPQTAPGQSNSGQPSVPQNPRQSVNQNIPGLNGSQVNQSQPYQQSWNPTPPAPGNSLIANNPSTMTAGWGRDQQPANPATNSYPPSSNTSNFQPITVNMPDAWPKQSDVNLKNQYTAPPPPPVQTQPVNPVVAQSSVIENRPSFSSSVEAMNIPRPQPGQSTTSYAGSSYMPPVSTLVNPQPGQPSTYVSRTITSTSFGPDGQPVTKVETTTQDGNTVRRTSELQTGPTNISSSSMNYTNTYQYGTPMGATNPGGHTTTTESRTYTSSVSNSRLGPQY
jgi:hypothetical protein